MDEKTFYTKILRIKPPWYVKQVVMDESAQRIDIYLDHVTFPPKTRALALRVSG
jgi:hypothetical protein